MAVLNIIVNGAAALGQVRSFTQALGLMSAAGNTAAATLRGMSNVLSYVASGLAGAFNVIRSLMPIELIARFGQTIYQTINRFQGFISAMTVVTESTAAAREEFQFVLNTANKYGVSIDGLVQSYAKLSAASKNTTLEGQPIRDLFDALTMASSALHLSAQDVNLVLFAMQQVVSKNTLSMEELRRQLAERLPGAVEMAAAAMNRSVQQLEEDIRNRKITAEQFVGEFAEVLKTRFAEAAEVSSKTLYASINRVTNAWEIFLLRMSESKVLVETIKFVDSLFSILHNNEKVAQTVGDALGELVERANQFISSLSEEQIKGFIDAAVKSFEVFLNIVGRIFVILEKVVPLIEKFVVGVERLANLDLTKLALVGNPFAMGIGDAFGPENPLADLPSLLNKFRKDPGSASGKITGLPIMSDEEITKYIDDRLRPAERQRDLAGKRLNDLKTQVEMENNILNIKTKQYDAGARLRELDRDIATERARLANPLISSVEQTEAGRNLLSMYKEYPKVFKDAQEQMRKFGVEHKKQFEDSDRFIAKLSEEQAKLSMNATAFELYNAKVAVSTIANKELREAVFARIETMIYANQEMERTQDLFKEEADLLEEMAENYRDETESIIEKTQALSDETEKLGLLKEEITTLEIARLNEAKATLIQREAQTRRMDVSTLENELIKDQIRATNDLINAKNKGDIKTQINDILKEVEAIQKEIDTITLSKEAIEDLTTARYEDLLARQKQYLEVNILELTGEEIRSTESLIRSLEELITARKRLRNLGPQKDAIEEFEKSQTDLIDKTQKKWDSANENISNSLTDAILRGFEAGKSGIDVFIDTLKNMFRTTVLKPIIQPIVNMTAGAVNSFLWGGPEGGSGGIMGQLGTSLFGESAQGGVGSILQSIFGSSGLSGTMGSGIMSIGSSLGIGALESFGAGMSGVAQLAGPGMMANSLGSMLGAAMPWALPALAIGAFFLSRSKGGPKSGGDFSGQFIGSNLVGSGFEDFYTPSDSNAAMETLTKTTNTSFRSTYKALGGTGSPLTQFGIGFDTDPQGTAPNRISSMVAVNGQEVYRTQDRDVGRSEEDLQKQLNLESKRMLLAALQASDLPAAVGNILKPITAAIADEETIDKALVLAQAIGGIFNQVNMDVFEEVDKYLDSISDGIYSLYHTQIEAVEDLVTSYDGSIEATEALSAANAKRYELEYQFVMQLHEASKAILQSAMDAKDQMILQTLNPEQAYKFYDTKTAEAYDAILTANDPQQIRELTQSGIRSITSAFNLLDSEQQRAKLAEFLKLVDDFNTRSQTRLTQLGEQVSADSQTLDQKITAAIEKAFAPVTQTQQTAADTMLTAANTLSGASITVDITGGGSNSQIYAVQSPQG